MSGTLISQPQRNPFVGPRPIQQGEPLYGRDLEVRELYTRLQARRIVVLHSPSGAGKSSLVQAGLVPRLLEGGYDVWKPIRVNLEPGGLEGVPEGTNRFLLSATVSLEDELPEANRRRPAALAGLEFADYLSNRPRRKGRGDRPVVLIFDQFEEVLTTAPLAVEARRTFFAEVGRALESERYWALFLIREDHLGALASLRDRIPTQMSNTFRLDLLGLDGAREAAKRLAEQGGRSFPAVDQLVGDLSRVHVQQADGSFVAEKGLYVEPVQLQVVCRRLWEAMPADRVSIDAEDIAAHASVSEALGGFYADTVRAIAGGDDMVERALRDWVGHKLIVGGLRSQIRREAGKTAGLDNKLIARLLDSYLVRSEPRAGAHWFELSHDRLVEPVERDNSAWAQTHLHAFQRQAKEWEDSRRAPAQLLGADALRDAQTWAKAHPTLLIEAEREFLERSRELHAKARETRWTNFAARAFAALLLAGTLLAAAAEGYRRWDVAWRIDRCEASGAEIDRWWNDEARQRVRAAFMATGAHYAATSADRVVSRLDEQARSWREARADVCLDAEVRELWDADLLNRAVWCLEERQMALGALLLEFSRADETLVQSAETTAASLGSIAACRDDIRLRRLPAPPTQGRELIRMVHIKLARVHSLDLAGQHKEALELATQARELARTTDWPSILAAARAREGLMQTRVGNYSDAESVVTNAYFEATTAGDWEASARIAIELIGISNPHTNNGGGVWARLAEMALVHTGDREGLMEASRLLNLARFEVTTGRLNESPKLTERALELKERLLGPDHPDIADVLLFRAQVYSQRGDSWTAQASLERALTIETNAFGPDHHHLAEFLTKIGNIYLDLGEAAKARETFERALEITEKAPGPDRTYIVETLLGLASVYEGMEEYAEALPLLERARTLAERVDGSDSYELVEVLLRLAGVQYAVRAYAEARTLHERALVISERLHGPDGSGVAISLHGLAADLLAENRYGEALPLLERALPIFVLRGYMIDEMAETQFMLARALQAHNRDHARALALAGAARDRFREIGHADKIAEVEQFLADYERAKRGR